MTSRQTAGTNRRDGLVVTLACTAQFVDVIGVTLLIVALPAIQHDLALSAAMLSWVAGSYALVFGGFLVPGGWVADLLGRRAVFIGGSLLVAAGSVVCALAGSGGVLLAGRVLQGLGAAVAVPAALAMVLATLPPGPRRSRALGLWTMAGAAGGAFGFVLGGVVTQLVGWRWLFAAIGLVELLAAVVTPLIVGPVARRVTRLDVPGALLAITAVVALVWALNEGLGRPAAWAGLIVAIAAGLLFALVERRAAVPMVPPRVWRLPSFRLGAGVAAVLTATTSGANVIGTLFAQDVLGLSGAVSGACFLLFSAGVVVSSTLAPGALRRISARPAMTIGLAVIAASMTVQALGVSGESLWVFLAGLTLSGLGLGLASVASTAQGTAEATEETSGLLGGLLNAAAQIGTAIGIAVLLAAPGGQTTAYLVAAGLAVLATAVCACPSPVRVTR
ncbi:MFS transporter [Paractinoplanes deccanensis]|uniref:MFS transporter n=1 Tax=Paractinoplanes deccanensis TaxID=113561 RepID=A0ABQ3YJM8_9ACTN|nr:MFS transporter [Actinoplanes deccanensis]GID80211.1 MFS transporter [Actinoplanes deccanensis]